MLVARFKWLSCQGKSGLTPLPHQPLGQLTPSSSIHIAAPQDHDWPRSVDRADAGLTFLRDALPIPTVRQAQHRHRIVVAHAVGLSQKLRNGFRSAINVAHGLRLPAPAAPLICQSFLKISQSPIKLLGLNQFRL
jgi:hypothetical protein